MKILIFKRLKFKNLILKKIKKFNIKSLLICYYYISILYVNEI